MHGKRTSALLTRNHQIKKSTEALQKQLQHLHVHFNQHVQQQQQHQQAQQQGTTLKTVFSKAPREQRAFREQREQREKQTAKRRTLKQSLRRSSQNKSVKHTLRLLYDVIVWQIVLTPILLTTGITWCNHTTQVTLTDTRASCLFPPSLVRARGWLRCRELWALTCKSSLQVGNNIDAYALMK